MGGWVDSTVELEKAAEQLSELAEELQQKGHGPMAAEVGKLEAKLRTAANAGMEAENEHEEKKNKDEARAAVGQMQEVAAALRDGGDEEVADEIELWATAIHNEGSVEEMGCRVAGGKKAVAKLEALGHHKEAEALGDLVEKLEGTAVAAQEVQERKVVLKGDKAAL